MVEQRVISRETRLEDTQYKWGFELDIESDVAPRGLSEEIVRLISAKKKEPDWMLDWRLKAYRHWLKLGTEEPRWAKRRVLAHRLPGHHLLCGAALSGRRTQKPRRGGPGDPGGLR